MFGLKKSPLHRLSKHKSAEPGFPIKSSSNPFDSDNQLGDRLSLKTSGRTSSEPSLVTSNLNSNPFDDYIIKESSFSHNFLSARNKYRNDFRDSGGLENQTVQELESYVVYKAEDTTKTVNNCLKIAEDMREDATKTLVMLHQQGEQITRTHVAAADIDHDLSRGEKLLGSLGGMFHKTWKPKRTRPIRGPAIITDDSVHRKGNHLEQRERLGLASASKERSHRRTPPPETTNALQKVEIEKAKQDDAFADISNVLGELKDMAIDMGLEIDRQIGAAVDLEGEVDVLNSRVKDSNQRARYLLAR
ncbi:SNAP25 homologous protein SNAP33-like [Primulina huaijiensis]|uniref:SNAP25 homologous protein SNAP33-like n=1 Tax=Primulina huaijiensis TaxID=1492673 RepID=UPI003CC7253E